MAGFSVDILAKINLKNVEDQIKSLNGTQITLNNFDLSGLHNAVQRELSSGRFSIRVDNIDLQNMTQQMNRVGTQAGQELGRAINSTLGNITSRNSAHTMRGLEQALAGFKFDRAQIDQITRGFDEMNIAVTRVRQNIHQQGRFRLNVEGVDEFGNIVTIVKELNNQTGELTTISKHINHDFTAVTNGANDAYTGISNLIDRIGKGQKALLNPNLGTNEIQALQTELEGLRQEYIRTMEEFGGGLSNRQNQAITRKWRNLDSDLTQGRAHNADVAAMQVQNEQMRRQAESMQQLIKYRKQMDNLDVGIHKLELAGGHENELKELRGLRSNIGVAYADALKSVDIGSAPVEQVQKLTESFEQAENKIRSMSAASKDKIELNIDNSIKDIGGKIDDELKKYSNVKGASNLFDGATSALEDVKKLRTELNGESVGNNAFNDISNKITAGLEDANTQLDLAKQKASELQKSFNLISSGKAESRITSVLKDYDLLGKSGKDSFSGLQNELDKIREFKEDLFRGVDISELAKGYPELSSALDKVENKLKAVKSEAKGTVSAFDVSSAKNDMTTWLNKNTKAVKDYGDAIAVLQNRLDGLDISSSDAKSNLSNIKKEFNDIKKAAAAAGKTGNTWGDQLSGAFKSIARYVSISDIFHKAKETVTEMYQNVVEIDTAMTSLKKVTDETDASYSNFLSNASKDAVNLGRTVSSLVEQTATWAKLGYSMSDSADLAKISSIYANVGEVSDETAVSDIVTAMKGFGLETEQAIQVVDALNALGKVLPHFAVMRF